MELVACDMQLFPIEENMLLSCLLGRYIKRETEEANITFDVSVNLLTG